MLNALKYFRVFLSDNYVTVCPDPAQHGGILPKQDTMDKNEQNQRCDAIKCNAI